MVSGKTAPLRLTGGTRGQTARRFTCGNLALALQAEQDRQVGLFVDHGERGSRQASRLSYLAPPLRLIALQDRHHRQCDGDDEANADRPGQDSLPAGSPPAALDHILGVKAGRRGLLVFALAAPSSRARSIPLRLRHLVRPWQRVPD